ncbi:hypothetical protein NKK48_01415 [Mesorhizobium sp. C386A]|uniref:hypothetical protein n=1 Tax=unclassified Mesorhizobium TaxID=325217 RepID=UPI0003CDFFBD|nr:hypothetical protein [Mesorhizobium sp. LNJC386A00]ESY35740.1 hypothetical protein X748_14095 [Mesorhizobium sp. LNJC386A00]
MITQEQFDRVYLGLAAQGWQRSYSDHHMQCMYRGPKNCKCAIGQLIDDDEYIPEMDNFSVGVFNLDDFQRRGLFMDLAKQEFRDLQSAHDSNDFPREMNAAFDTLAGKYGLNVPVTP